jgi:ribosomal protein L37AE/L43A
MLTAAQYERAWKSHINRPLAVVTAMLFAWNCFAVVLALLTVEAGMQSAEQGHEPSWMICGGVVAGNFAYVLALILFLNWQRNANRDERLHCPKCRTFLRRLRRVTYSKRCYRCGEEVLDGATPPDLKPLAELETAAQRKARGRPWEIVFYVSNAIILVVLLAWVLRVGEYLESPLRLLGYELLFMTGWFLVNWPLMRRIQPDPRLACPHCGEQLSIERVRKTNRCGNCGRIAVSDPVIRRVADRPGVEPSGGGG